MSSLQRNMEPSDLLEYHLYEDNSLLDEIDRIVKERWRVIERTTRYGWLSAQFYGKVLSNEEAELISALGKKIDMEDRDKAIEKIRKFSHDLHPRYIPSLALALLNETYTAAMLRVGRSKNFNTRISLEAGTSTIFTISTVQSMD